MKVLFILKRRLDYNLDPGYGDLGLSTGLLNSATFMHEMLLDCGVESKLVVVVDNNCIDREVTQFRPDVVIIEALWVVPEKFKVLTRLHPKVQWIVRYHSETPFIASEGIAMKWSSGYADYYPKVKLGVNAPRFLGELRTVISAGGKISGSDIEDFIFYLPNYYPAMLQAKAVRHQIINYIDVGCFGAIRPLKNQLLQAIAALKYARSINKKLRFHINSGRVEMKGEPIRNNLISLFQGIADEGHELVVHGWMCHEKFTQLIREEIDIGLQCSFSETFCIVAADFVSNAVPFVGSKEIPWISFDADADPNDSDDIASKMDHVMRHPNINVFLNSLNLVNYSKKSKKIWAKYFC